MLIYALLPSLITKQMYLSLYNMNIDHQINVPSSIGFDPESQAPEMAELHKHIERFIVKDVDEFIKENHLEGTLSEKHLQDLQIKSGYTLRLSNANKLLGLLVVYNTVKKREFSQEDIVFAQSIADQIGVALFQAELYEKEKKTAERETLLRRIIESIRSTLDINVIKNSFVNEIGLHFKADRVVLSEFDSEAEVFLSTDKYSEYIVNPDIQSLVGYDWALKEAQPYIQSLMEQKEINIIDLDKYLKDKNLENSNFERLFREWQIKSSYNILIMYGKEIMGFFCVDYLNEIFEIDKKELELLRTISNQAGIALYHAKLYEKEKKTAEREILLRKTIEKIRSSLDINETLTFICDEVAKIFNVQRATIVEFPDHNNYEKFIMRREYKVSPEIKGIEDYKGYEYLAKYWGNRVFSEKTIINYDNISDSDAPDNVKEYYKNLGVKSIIGSPIKKMGIYGGLLFYLNTIISDTGQRKKNSSLTLFPDKYVLL